MKKQENKKRILAKNMYMSNDTRETGLNNNDLIVGPSGAGKTRGYVMPNIMQCNESMVVVDTKGNLERKTGDILRENGYEVYTLDLINPEKSIGYNPFDYIRRDKKTGKYSEMDIMKIANSLAPVTDMRDPFWQESAQIIITSYIAFVLETNPENPNFRNILDLFRMWDKETYKQIFTELQLENPKSYAVKKYKMYNNIMDSERTSECIKQFVAKALNIFDFSEINEMMRNKEKIDIADLGRKKMAIFVNISDTDRSLDNFAKIFYDQLFQVLCNSADNDRANCRLKVPVRIILDDFASNFRIQNFDKIISVIRSREISVSIILQSISQLSSMYQHGEAETIINNCDNMLYLGGQDIKTADLISIKGNIPRSKVLSMPINEVYLFTRGQEPKRVEKYELKEHEEYEALLENNEKKKSKKRKNEECEIKE